MFPIMSSFGDKQDAQIEYGTLRDGSLPSIYSSSDSVDKNWSPPPNHKEDLYSWMAKQSEKEEKDKDHSTADKTAHDIERPASPRPAIHSYMQDSQRLLDAHLIFEPMLTCLGVMPSQMINNVSNPDISSLDSLGTNLSLVGSFDAMKIDIVVSETNENGKKTAKSKLAKKPGGNGKFGLSIAPHSCASASASNWR
jgi:hypothetical protein